MTGAAGGYQRFFAELKRRRVFRVMAVYGIVGWVLLQVVDLAVPALLLPDWTYRLIALILLLGFPVAILLTWAFEVTPQGVQRTAPADPHELHAIIAAPASQRWPAGMLALLGAVVLVAGAWYAGRQSTPDATTTAGAREASIAVLPFVNMSDDVGNEFFSDGISEELLNLLARIPELRVTSRSSAFSYKGRDVRLAEIARELGVDHVLEGSVRKDGDQVRITAQLIDARSDSHLWSETWDRRLDDVFAIQDEIAAEVADRLQVTLLGRVLEVEEADPEAYALYLQARYLARQGTAEALLSARDLYERAIAIDPEYAPVRAGLASTLIEALSLLETAQDSAWARARRSAEKAIQLDPESADAYAVLARIAINRDRDLESGARYAERALELDPGNSEVLNAGTYVAQYLGRLDQAIAIGEHSAARDPVNPNAHYRLAWVYRWAGRYDDAIAAFRTTLRLSPQHSAVNYGIGESLLLKGEAEAALAAIQGEPNEFWLAVGLPMAYHALGRAQEADSALQELISEFETEAAYNIAYALAYWNETDRAFEWLAKAVQYNDPGLAEIPVEQLFANLHGDPRWLPFLESIGKAPDQLGSVEFDVRLPR